MVVGVEPAGGEAGLARGVQRLPVAEEAVERVTRSIGRTSGPQLSSARPYIQGLPVPEVALFADSNWERDPRPPVTKEAAWDYFATFVQGVTAEANALVLRLHAAVTSSVTTATKLSASR